MTTRVSSKGQIVLPATIRQQDNVKAGEEFEVQRLDRGGYRLGGGPAPAEEGVVGVVAELRRKGKSMPIKDSLIAATALVHGLTVATRNVRDFREVGVKVVDLFAREGE